MLFGRQELGYVHETTFLARRDDGPLVLLLAGRSWRLTHLDWKRWQAYVEPFEGGGRSRWRGEGQPLDFALCEAIRGVLVGDAEEPYWSRRARRQIAEVRGEFPWLKDGSGSVLLIERGQAAWWTFAGGRANASLGHDLARRLGSRATWDNFAIRCTAEDGARELQPALRDLRSCPLNEFFPAIDERGVEGLKFSECLPPDLATRVVQARLCDPQAVTRILGQPVRLVVGASGP